MILSICLEKEKPSRAVPGTKDTSLVLVLMWKGSFELRNRYHLNRHTLLARATWDRTEQLTFKGFAKVPVTGPTTHLETFSSFSHFPYFSTLWPTPNFLKILRDEFCPICILSYTIPIYCTVLVKKIVIELPVVFRYKVNWSCRVSLIFSGLICTVIKLIQFLIEWHTGLDAHSAEENTIQVHGTGTI